MEPLILQPVEEWPRLRDYFKTYRPFGIAGYNLLDTQIHFHNLCLDCPFQVYCPYGDVANGIVAKIEKKNLHELIILAASEETTKLEQALIKTSVIDWSKGRTEVPFVMPGSTRNMLDQVYPRLGLKLVMEGPGYIHVYDRNSEPNTNVSPPEGTYLAPVRPEHVPQVDRAWPYRSPSSDWFFNLLILAGQSYGLFSLDHSLVAWVFINDAGHLCHLYCEDQHRKKGYAECIVKHVINDQAIKAKDVLCYTVEGNLKATKLFSKLGFKHIGISSWMYFEKQ